MSNFKAEIFISLRKDILDVQGKAIENSMKTTMNKSPFSNIRVGKFITLDVEANDKNHAQNIVNDITNTLLANPIMEDHTIVISDI
jgi:phosphoribosylformylglycinamidine synthase